MKDATPLTYRIENIAPILAVSDMAKSLAFYVDILGFQNAAWADEYFTYINRDGTGLYLCKGAQGNAGTWIWIGFDGDIFQLYEQLLAHQVNIKLPPTNYYWAYELHIYDPDGHVLRLGTSPNENEPYVNA